MTYKLLHDPLSNKDYGVVKTNEDGSTTSFLFDPANTDYQAFLKYQAEGGKVYGADEEVPVINTPIPADE
jgi:hypothetical protein